MGGDREGDREGERERAAGREGGARAKPGNQLVTYKSGGRRSVIDYILIRRNNISKVKDCKVIPGESISSSSCVCHHAPLICPEHCSRAMLASHRPEQ